MADPEVGTDPDRLQALADGYFGLGWLFFGNALVFAALEWAVYYYQRLDFRLAFASLILVVGVLSYRPNLRMVQGIGASERWAILYSVLTALNAGLCGGVLIFAVQMAMVRAEARRYGVKKGLLSRKSVRDRVLELRAAKGQASEPLRL